MSVAIVGHGPSMLKSKSGIEIDSHDVVIRQKAIGKVILDSNPADFGSKVSYICGSWTIRNTLFWAPVPVWVFCDSRHSNIRLLGNENYKVLLNECNYWNEFYRNKRTKNYMRNEKMTIHKTSSEIGHNHMSCGLHTIMYTCELLNPSKIILYGFDNIKSGEFTWSLTRGEDWNEYPDHRWDIENLLLNEFKVKYNVEFEFKP